MRHLSGFSLANPLSSITSAARFRALFGNFSGTMGLSDVPYSFVVGLRFRASQRGLQPLRLEANMGFPGSRAGCFLACTMSTTVQGSDVSRDNDTPDAAFRNVPRRRHPGCRLIQRIYEVDLLLAPDVRARCVPPLHLLPIFPRCHISAPGPHHRRPSCQRTCLAGTIDNCKRWFLWENRCPKPISSVS
jgi:hypothetical protein